MTEALAKTPEEATPEEAKPLTRYQKLERDFSSERFMLAIRNALPETGVNAEKFVRFALTVLTKTPKLAECTEASIASCLLDCASMGIEPDGRRAHLIPYKNSWKEGDRWMSQMICTLQLDYKGIVELVRRSGKVSNICANVVHENDEFDFIEGTGSFLKHKRTLKDRGDLLCVYSFIRFTDGSDSFELMTIDEVNAVRDKSQGYIAALKNAKQYQKDPHHPWIDHWEAMARKTVFKKHSKWLELSSEVQQALIKDDQQEVLSPAERAAIAKPAIPVDATDLFNKMADETVVVEDPRDEIASPESPETATTAKKGAAKKGAAKKNAVAKSTTPAKTAKAPAPKKPDKFYDEFRAQLEMLDIAELTFLQWCQENKHLNWTEESPPTLEALSIPKIQELEPDLMTIAEEILK